MFNKVERIYDNVTSEQLNAIKKAIRNLNGKVKKKGNIVIVTFYDNFPESIFANHTSKTFDERVKDLGLFKFTGMKELI